MECFKNHDFVNEGFEIFGLVAVAGGGRDEEIKKLKLKVQNQS